MLEAEKEKRLVVSVVKFPENDGSPNRKPIVVLPLRVPDMLPCLRRVVCDGGSVGERYSRIQKFIHQIIVCAAVELVRTGFHRVVEIAAARLSVLGGIIARLNGNLLDRIDPGLSHLVLLTPHTIGRVLTLDSNSLRTGRHAVNAKRVVVVKRCSRQKRNRLQWISNIAEASEAREGDHGQVVQLVGGDVLADFAAFGLQQRALGFYRNGLRRSADL